MLLALWVSINPQPGASTCVAEVATDHEAPWKRRPGLCTCFSLRLSQHPSLVLLIHTLARRHGQNKISIPPKSPKFHKLKTKTGVVVSPLLADPEQRVLRQLPWSLSALTPFEGTQDPQRLIRTLSTCLGLSGEVRWVTTNGPRPACSAGRGSKLPSPGSCFSWVPLCSGAAAQGHRVSHLSYRQGSL